MFHTGSRVHVKSVRVDGLGVVISRPTVGGRAVVAGTWFVRMDDGGTVGVGHHALSEARA